MSPEPDENPTAFVELLDQDLVPELLRAIHDRLRTIEAVETAVLAELRHHTQLYHRAATRRAD